MLGNIKNSPRDEENFDTEMSMLTLTDWISRYGLEKYAVPLRARLACGPASDLFVLRAFDEKSVVALLDGENFDNDEEFRQLFGDSSRKLDESEDDVVDENEPMMLPDEKRVFMRAW